MMLKQMMVLVLGWLMLGCATIPKNIAPLQDTESFQYPFNKVWGATIETMSEMGFPISSSDKDSGLLVTQEHVFAGSSAPEGRENVKKPGEWTYLPGTGHLLLNGGWDKVSHRINLFVSPIDQNQTKVKVTTSFNSIYTNGTAEKYPSRGVLESEIFQKIKSKL